MSTLRQNYIAQHRDTVVSSTAGTGLFPSVMMAQAIVESNSGQSRLAIQANNHFGIKCHGTWNGPTISANDDRPNECFRKYQSPLASFVDRNKFLEENPRYRKAGVFSAKTPQEQVDALVRAGYATSPTYRTVINSIIRKYNLESLDKQKADLPFTVVLNGRLTHANKPMLIAKGVFIITLIIIGYKLWQIKTR